MAWVVDHIEYLGWILAITAMSVQKCDITAIWTRGVGVMLKIKNDNKPNLECCESVSSRQTEGHQDRTTWDSYRVSVGHQS